MFRGQRVSKLFIFLALAFSFLVTAGFNMGSRWKGGFNSYQLASFLTHPAGFTSGRSPALSSDSTFELRTPLGVTVDSAGNYYIAENGNHSVLKYNSSGVLQGWIGNIGTSPTGGASGCVGATVGTSTPGWCTGGSAASGTGDGMFSGPRGITIDSSGNLYVVDGGNSRVEKFNSSGVFIGWTGGISTSPTGGAAGCAGATVGTATPGWCTGGRAQSGSEGEGIFNSASGIVFNNTLSEFYLFNDSGARLMKFNSSGVYQGWIGLIATSPTGGASGCAGATVGTVTPGWCLGGSSTSGSGDGMLGTTKGYPSLDASGNIYLPDPANYRVVKYNSSGVFQGWTGLVMNAPTGGAAGCTGASYGMTTPGWCKGGKSLYGTGTGALANVIGSAIDSSTGDLFFSDGTGRVQKFNSSGVIQGWIGGVNIAPTGGVSGCTTTLSGSYTPGWCTGGSHLSGASDGLFSSPAGMIVDPSGQLIVSDQGARIMKYSTAGVYQGAIQSVPSFNPWNRSAGQLVTGKGDGNLNSPHGITVDSSGNVYIADEGNSRILKYNSAGTFLGWVGSVSVLPTGGASGCTSASPGSMTPGWCTGGTATSSGGIYPRALALDGSGNIFLADMINHRIVKFHSSGVVQGWIGKIGTSPTGGVTGCAGASVGTVTPGWCTGGNGSSGTGDGMLSNPVSIALDLSGNIYVLDGSPRISKFDSSGVFQGWIGKIATSPTGGASGCAGAAVGSAAPGWCTGGAAGSGTGDGMLNAPMGMRVDGSGNIYVGDTGNYRVSKYSSAGVFLGWSGKIATSPTGGTTGCAGASVGSVTPGWCTGGAAGIGSSDGQFGSPDEVALDSSGNIYVADNGYHRIVKLNSSGTYQGWIGKIGTSPTGGGTGCKNAAVGTITPGWCTGGSSVNGSEPGAFKNPWGSFIDQRGDLYITESNQIRAQRIPLQGR